MSLNLTYDYFNDNGDCVSCEDFAFQTPSELTLKVLAAPYKSDQVKIIKAAIEKWDWDNVEYLIAGIEKTLNDPRVKLGMI